MKTYEARVFGNVFVVENHKRRVLPPRLDLCNHSPSGLSWGYLGSGCAQTALAILCDVYDDERALRLYQRFKEKVIARQNRDAPLLIEVSQVLKAVEEIEEEPA